MYADASLYLAADRRSPYPYLWFLGIAHIPGALQQLRDTLAGPAAPRYIAVYQQPRTLDKSGRADSIGTTLQRRYRHTATVDGVPIWRLRAALSAYCFFMPCTGRPCACQANSVIVGRSSS